jgi:prepilin-type N-terminal cleavage/methylation domain-containing protein
MKKSFTLIELIIVIAILGILAALISGNFITSLKKGRDAKRKSDFEQIKNALEMFYEDKKHYPSSLQFGGTRENTCAFGEKVTCKFPKITLTTGFINNNPIKWRLFRLIFLY